jgi:hypothetical protein
MANDAFRLQGQIGVDTTPLQTGLKQASTVVQTFAGALASGLGMGAGIAAFGGLQQAATAFTDTLKGVAQAAMGEEVTLARVNSILKSTGANARLTTSDVVGLGEGLAKVTTFGHDAIIAGETILLTFGDMANNLPKATEAVLNMAALMGTDASGAAMALGMALEEPISGVARLRRAGIMLTEAQQEQIKSFMAAGQKAQAAGVIFDVVQTKAGGLARALGETAQGRIAQFHDAMESLQESVGGLILPAMTTKVLFVTEGVEAVQAAIKAIQDKSPITVQTIIAGGGVSPAGAGTTYMAPILGAGQRILAAQQAIEGATSVDQVNTQIIKVNAALETARDALTGLQGQQLIDATDNENLLEMQVGTINRLIALKRESGELDLMQAQAQEQENAALMESFKQIGMLRAGNAAAPWGEIEAGGARPMTQYINGLKITTNAMEDLGAVANNVARPFYDQAVAYDRAASAGNRYTVALHGILTALGGMAGGSNQAVYQIERVAYALNLAKTQAMFSVGGTEANWSKLVKQRMGEDDVIRNDKQRQAAEDKRLADEAARAGKAYWQDMASKAKEAQDRIQGFITFTGSPSYRGGLVGTSSQLGNAWDERARRIEDIGNLGGKSPWAAGETGWQGLNDPQRQAWAQMQAANIREHPSIGNIGPEGMAALVDQAKANIGYEIDKRELYKAAQAALLADPTAVANMERLGINVKDAFAEPSDKIVSSVDAGSRAIVDAILGRKPKDETVTPTTTTPTDAGEKYGSRPGYASGGVIPGTGPVPIIAHGRENVFTPEQMRQIVLNLAGGGGQAITMYNPTFQGVNDLKGLFAEMSRIMPAL